MISSGSVPKNDNKKTSIKKPQSLNKILHNIEKQLTRLNSRSNLIVSQNRCLQSQVRDIAQRQSNNSKVRLYIIQTAKDMKEQIESIHDLCYKNRRSLAAIESYYTGNSEVDLGLRHS